MPSSRETRARTTALLALYALAQGCVPDPPPANTSAASASMREAKPKDRPVLGSARPASPAVVSAAAGSGGIIDARRPSPPATMTSAAGAASLPSAAGKPLAPTQTAKSNITLPPTTGAFDYQLESRYPADARVKIVSSDASLSASTGKPVAGAQPLDTTKYNICYLNVFQTQPEDQSFWLGSHPDLILKDAAGQPIHDPDPEWDGEMLFDLSTAAKRTQLLAIQKSWIAGCRSSGFKAIEPDNLDAADRAQGRYTVEDAASYMKLFVAEAHAQALAVAQKNVAEWVSQVGADGLPRSKSIGFDFSIIEECQLTGECNSVISFYGAARVFEIEYVYETDDDSSGVRVAAHTSQHFDMACAARGNSVRMVLRNRDVRPATAAGYVFQLCGGQTGSAATSSSNAKDAGAGMGSEDEMERWDAAAASGRSRQPMTPASGNGEQDPETMTPAHSRSSESPPAILRFTRAPCPV